MRTPSPGMAAVERLRRARPKNWGARASIAALAVLAVGSWIVRDFGLTELASARRLANLENFAAELVPFPFRSADFEFGVLWTWISGMMRSRGFEAALNTLAISIAAIVLAGVVGALLSLVAARTLMTASPFLPASGSALAATEWGWILARSACRLFMIFARSIPEYIWAFLFLAMLGPMAWALVLALALHNAGILGRLGAEVVENTESPPLAALRALGATRAQLALSAVFPLAFSRFLLFFLYRWETCVREATVLGMLGIASLGFWIQDARARNTYDEMFLLILIGGVLVIIGDVVSSLVREWVRRQG